MQSQTTQESLFDAAAQLGRIGGSRNTPAQAAARIENAASARAARKPKQNECGHSERPHHGKNRCKSYFATLRYHEKHPGARYRGERGPSVLERFMARVVETPTGCWLWAGAKKSEREGSYPLFRDPNKKSPEHAVRWAFENIRGNPAPKRGSGLELSHQPDRCQFMSRCCNPAHCEIETRAANLARRDPELIRKVMANARAHKGPPKVNSHCRNGHLRTPDNLSRWNRCKTCRRERDREHIRHSAKQSSRSKP